MRTTIDIPQDLVEDAMEITQARTKTELIKIALENIIKTQKISRLIEYHGSLDLQLDLDNLRKR